MVLQQVLVYASNENDISVGIIILLCVMCIIMSTKVMLPAVHCLPCDFLCCHLKRPAATDKTTHTTHPNLTKQSLMSYATAPVQAYTTTLKRLLLKYYTRCLTETVSNRSLI